VKGYIEIQEFSLLLNCRLHAGHMLV